MKAKRLLFIPLIAVIACSSLLAHNGRTDGSGGHRDNKNVSGLGSYHYHCGGYPEHLHYDGVCPYDSTSSSNALAVAKTSKPKYTEKKVTFSIAGEINKVDAVNANNTNLVELRTLCDKLGIVIENYDSTLKTIDCKKDDVAFTFQVDSNTMWKGTELVTLDVAPIIHNGKTMIPARIIAEAIGKTVNYDAVTDSIIID